MPDFKKSNAFDAAYDAALNLIAAAVAVYVISKLFKVKFGLPTNFADFIKLLTIFAIANVLVRYLQIKKYVASEPIDIVEYAVAIMFAIKLGFVFVDCATARLRQNVVKLHSKIKELLKEEDEDEENAENSSISSISSITSVSTLSSDDDE